MGVITNEEKRVVEIQLSFLDKDVTYEAKIFSDTTETHYKSNPSSIKIETRDVTINETLKLLIAPGGGAAIKITPKID
jgi:alpha-glucosidase